MTEPTDKLFRAAALKQLNSPDDLDRLVRVTRPIGWVAGLALALMIAAVLGWSVIGHLPSRVLGDGLVLPQGGRVVEMQARGAGIISDLSVGVGDHVALGQMIGHLGSIERELELATVRKDLAERQRELAQIHIAAQSEARLRTESLRRQRAAIDLRIQTARGREATLLERFATTQQLFRERLVTRAQVIGTQNDLETARQELSNAASDAARLGADELEVQRLSDDRLRERQRAVGDTARRAEELATNLADQLTLRSPTTGTVLEVRTQPGSLVRPGQQILALNQSDDRLEIVAFVSSADGRRVRLGMEVRVALSSARREEVGTLEGEVASVSQFPLSFEAINAIIGNGDLAKTFTRSGPPFLVRIRLRPDADSVSGYRWTSRRGDTVVVSSGIPARVEIVTALRRPIALVIPALRELLAI